MMGAAAQQPSQPPTLEDLIDEVVERAKQGASVATPLEAERIIRKLKQSNPQGLMAWFEDHMRDIVREELQYKLKSLRSKARRTRASRVFAEYQEQVDAGEVAGPLEVPYYITDVGWKPLGDLTRPDWQVIIDDRKANAKASIFEIALAKAMVKRLPDDSTKTRDVASADQVIAFEDKAHTESDRIVNRV